MLAATFDEFESVLQRESHTFRRALTDPHLFSGIGNAHSDEILDRARPSPPALARKLERDEAERFFAATREVLIGWTNRPRAEAGDGFPEKVAAFRPGMPVHGRLGGPSPVCGTPSQRFRYAEKKTNYCPRCQTEGRILADRSLSRLLQADWTRHLEEL